MNTEMTIALEEVMYAPGPGDPETWGPCTGHPLDPRTDDDEWSDECDEDEQADGGPTEDV